MKISVITAVLDNRATVESALESVQAQRGVDVEHIVVDGGSRDGTLALLERHRPRIAVLISEPDQGLYDALNKGLRRATGDIVGLLHADDQYADNRVLAQVAAAFADPAVGAVYGDLVYVRRDDPARIIRYWNSGAFSPAKLRWGWMPPHPTVFVRRAVHERIGDYDLGYRIAADYDYLLRLLGREAITCVYLPDVLVQMRQGGASNRSLRNILQKSREDYHALRRNRVGGLGALLLKNLQKLPQFFTRPGG